MEPPPPVTVLRKHESAVTSVSFSKDGNLLSTSRGGELFLWDIRLRRVKVQITQNRQEDDGYLRAVSNNDVIAVNSRLGTIQVFDFEGKLKLEQKTGNACGFAGCRMRGNDVYFADAFNSKLCVLDMNSSHWFPLAITSGHGMIMDISLYQDYVALCLEDSTIQVYDQRNTTDVAWSATLKRTDPTVSVALLNSERCIVGGSEKYVYDVRPDAFDSFYEMPHAGVDDIAVRDDGKLWLFSGWDGRLRVFDAKKRIPLAVLKHHEGCIHTVAFAENNLFASAGEDRGIAIWDLYSKSNKK